MTTDSTTQLNLDDLGFAVKLIDTCAKRGAFDGDELQNVGALRQRMVNCAKVLKEVPYQDNQDNLITLNETV